MENLIVQNDATTRLPDNTYKSRSFSGLTNAIIQAIHPRQAIVAGPQALRFNDDCTGVNLVGLVFTELYHVWDTGSSTYYNCEWNNTGREGLLAGGKGKIVVVSCYATRCGYGPSLPGDDHKSDTGARHPWYFGYGLQKAELRNSAAYDCLGCLHTNRNADEGIPSRGFRASDVRLRKCGSDGTHAIQLDATHDALLEEIFNVDPRVGCLCLWGDGTDDEGCQDVTFDRFTFISAGGSGRACITLGAQTVRTHLKNGVIVLDDMPLYDGTEESGEHEEPTFENVIVFGRSESQIPDAARGSVDFRTMDRLNDFFTDLTDYQIKDPIGASLGYSGQPDPVKLPPVTTPPATKPPVTVPVTTLPVTTAPPAPRPIDVPGITLALKKAVQSSGALRHEAQQVVNDHRRTNLVHGLDDLDLQLAAIKRGLGQ